MSYFFAVFFYIEIPRVKLLYPLCSFFLCLPFLSFTLINSNGRLKIYLNLHSTHPRRRKSFIILTLNINGEREMFCWFPPKNAYCFEDPVDENLLSNCQIKNYLRICFMFWKPLSFEGEPWSN